MNFKIRNPLRWVLTLAALALCFGPWAPAGVCLGMAIVTGARANPATSGTNTGGIDSSSRVIDMSDTIHLLDPNEAPLTAITMKMRKAHCISPKVEWLEDDYLPTTTTLAATISSVSTSVQFAAAAGAQYRVGDVLQNMISGENIYITAISTDTATVTRAIGTTSQASYSASSTETWLIIGNANQEGATGRTIKTTTKTNQSNFTQITA